MMCDPPLPSALLSDTPELPRAFVTLLTDEGFLSGALCLLKSLACTSVPTCVPTTVVIVTRAVGSLARARLKRVGATVMEVPPITLRLGPASAPSSLGSAPSGAGGPHVGGGGAEGEHVTTPSASAASAAASHVPSWTEAGLTKLHLWNLTQFSKVVYLDADTIVLRNVDELFERPGMPLSAAPDLFPPDHFNAGVLVVRPDPAVFAAMMAASERLHSYDGGDTGFLNAFFPEWFGLPSTHRLPFAYNAQRTLQWLTKAAPGYWAAVVGKGVKVLHFSSSPKPWQAKPGGAQSELDMVWWSVFTDGKIPAL